MNKSAILINDTSTEAHVGSKTVCDNIRKLCLDNGVKVISSYTRKDIDVWADRLEPFLEQADIVILNGEGSLHDNPDFIDTLVEKQSVFDNKKMVLINSLWQRMEYGDKENEFFDRFSLMSFRETKSALEFQEFFGTDKRVMVVPDIVFATPKIDYSLSYGDSVVTEKREIFKTYPNYFPMNYLSNYPDIHAYIQWLKGSKIHITGRFHGVCLCTYAGVPFLAVNSNSHKIESMLADMGCGELLLPCIKQAGERLERATGALPKIIKYGEEAKPKVEQLFKKIGQL